MSKIHPFVLEETGVKLKDQSEETEETGVKLDDQSEKIEETEDRENWSGKFDFFLSALSFSVGLGAIYRFPYLCYRYGGGAFVIPFIILMFVIGIPLMYLELAVGQFKSRGPVLSWVMVPLFKGLGISMNVMNNYVNIYYIMVVAYSLYYIYLTCYYITGLPWSECGDWASENCVSNFTNFTFNRCENETEQLKCGTDCFSNIKNLTCEDKDKLDYLGKFDFNFPSLDYWNNKILDKSDGIDESGHFVPHLIIVLAISWIICFLAVFRGVKVSGKIMYIITLLPYVVLLTLGIFALTFDGALDGAKYLFVPETGKDLDMIIVWKEAGVQVFYTLTLAQGGNIALSSYNKFHNNILRNAVMLSITNLLTCILAGLVVFLYIGILAKETQVDFEYIVPDGNGLIYYVYPYAVTKLPAAPLWSFLFFIMIFCLGMGTMMGAIETFVTSLEDMFPILKKNQRNKSINLAIICVIFFLIGLIFCLQSGDYWLEVFSAYAADWGLFVVGIIECLSVAWIYGIDNFEKDMSAMLKPRDEKNLKFHSIIFRWWEISWSIVSPIFLIIFLIYNWIENEPIRTENKVFPYWTHVFGHMLGASSMIGTFGFMLYEIIVTKKNGRSLSSLIKRDKMWRPALERNQDLVLQAYQSYPNYSFIYKIKNVLRKTSSKI